MATRRRKIKSKKKSQNMKRRSTKNRKRSKKKRSKKKKHKFQKRLTHEYVLKFTSPHRNDNDCAVCTLNFLNVLPKGILDDMIEEIGCHGVTLNEVITYFNRAYGNHNFRFEFSEIFITSKCKYRIDYMNRYLENLKQNILPGHACLFAMIRWSPRTNHFVVIGKGGNNVLTLFETQYNPHENTLGIIAGNNNIRDYLIKDQFVYACILKSDIVDNKTELNVDIPNRTSELSNKCKLINLDRRLVEKKYFDHIQEQIKMEQLLRENN